MRAHRFMGLAALLLLASCGKKDDPPPVDLARCQGLCGDGPLLAVRTLELIEADSTGAVVGYNLDGVEGPVSFDCPGDDFVSPDGTRGIDNQVAAILPVLKNVIGEALPTLLQTSVDEGGLSVIMEFVGLDDPLNDDEVHVVFHRGQGTPLLDAEGRLLAGQTYELSDDDEALGVCRSGKLVNGQFTCSGFDLRLTIVVFGVTYRLTFRDMVMKMDVTPDFESASLVFGGAVMTEDIVTVADIIGENDDIEGIIKDVVPPFADLPDPVTGECNRISGAIAMTARLGFVYR